MLSFCIFNIFNFIAFASSPIVFANSERLFAFSNVLFAIVMHFAFSFANPATIALAAPPAPINRTWFH